MEVWEKTYRIKPIIVTFCGNFEVQVIIFATENILVSGQFLDQRTIIRGE